MPNQDWWDQNGFGGGAGDYGGNTGTSGTMDPWNYNQYGPPQGTPTAPPPQAPAAAGGSPWTNPGDPIVALYQQYYGRPPSQQEWQTHTANIGAGQGNIQNIAQQLQQTATVPPGGQPQPQAQQGGGPFDMNAFGAYWQELTSSGNGSMQDFNTRVLPALQARFPGIKAFGSKGEKIELPNGMWFDGVKAAGTGGQGYNSFNPLPMGQGDGGGGSLIDPFQGQFNYPSFTPPPAFQAPSGSEVFEDPSYLFRRDEAIKAIDKSGSAKGTLRTGGHQKDLADWIGKNASQEYASVYGRRLGEHQMKYGQTSADWERDYSKAFGEFNLGRDIFYQNQDRPFSKLFSMSQLGQNSANAMSGAGQFYANQFGNNVFNGAQGAGNAYMGGANANAAGQVGSANAWNSFYGNQGNNAMNLWMMQQMMNQNPQN